MTDRKIFPYFAHEKRNADIEQILKLYRDGRLRFSSSDGPCERRFAIRQIMRCRLGWDVERNTSELAIACADAYIQTFGVESKVADARNFSCPPWAPSDRSK